MNTLSQIDCPRCLSRLPQAWRYDVGNQAADQLGHAMYYLHDLCSCTIALCIAGRIPDGE